MLPQSSVIRPRRYAVIGSGAAGCYVAEALLRGDPQARVEVIERLPTPFGLVRYGVAPDHQGTKAVARTLGRVLEQDRIAFYGGVDVGRDISLDAVRRQFDATILATGLNRDRRLGVHGESLEGVVGSGAFACWYNDHPFGQDFSSQVAESRNVLLIGAGNVTLDIARLLVKTQSGFLNSDLSPHVQQALCQQAGRKIVIAVRRGPEHVKFSLPELKELLRELPGRVRINMPAGNACFGVPSGTQGRDAVLSELLALPVTVEEAAKPSESMVEFRFHSRPMAFLASEGAPERVGHAEMLCETEGSEGVNDMLAADMVISCIGYEQTGRLKLPTENGAVENQDGLVDEGLYVVGWARRGANGTIGQNRADAYRVAARILEVEAAMAAAPGIEPLLQEKGLAWIDYEGWTRIDARERKQAKEGRCRLKLKGFAELLSAAAMPAALQSSPVRL